jgi:hypothetical protein
VTTENGVAATSAQVGYPEGLAIDANGDLVLGDSHDGLVDVLPARSCGGANQPGCDFGLSSMTVGDLSTIAGGGSTLGDGGSPTSVALGAGDGLGLSFDASGDFLLVAAAGEDRVRALTLAPPAEPTNLIASAASDAVNLSWSPSVAPAGAITNYEVLRSTSSGAETDFALVLPSQTSFSDDSVVPGSSYYYKVVALGVDGASAPSNEAQAAATTTTTTTFAFPTPVTYPTLPPLPPHAYVTLESTQLSLRKAHVAMKLLCLEATCRGTATLYESVVVIVKLTTDNKHSKKATTTVDKTELRPLGSSHRFAIADGNHATVKLALNSAGKKLLASASKSHPVSLVVVVRMAGAKYSYFVR